MLVSNINNRQAANKSKAVYSKSPMVCSTKSYTK
jgi:hypothetical protein